ncbi:DUF397 domain-containing protein [Nocardia sp. NPDC050406]|uniref:DUF397 domain-containing protein n=1 Tax=Nocardia sp. NPDC050406 TaxID=3364318 RepID=UPI0037BC1A42
MGNRKCGRGNLSRRLSAVSPRAAISTGRGVHMSKSQPSRSELRFGVWRKSSFSGTNGECVETTATSDGSIAVRNSNNPDAGTLLFRRAEMAAWISGCKAGEFDDLI